MVWKTKPGGCSGHWWLAAVPDLACDGLDPLSPLQVPYPPSHPLEGLRAGDEGGTVLCRCDHHDSLQRYTPWARPFCCGYAHVHACACKCVHTACAAAELELRRWHEANSNPCVCPQLAGRRGSVSDGTDAWLCLTCFYPVRNSAVPLLLSSHVSVPVVAHMDYRRQESWYVPAASKALPEG